MSDMVYCGYGMGNCMELSSTMWLPYNERSRMQQAEVVLLQGWNRQPTEILRHRLLSVAPKFISVLRHES